MFWETLWALVLGFTLSGAVQAFVSRGQMERALGDHRPRTLVRAGLLGAASSSCSYAASALAKTLFARGADFTAAQAVMFASTTLVVVLGPFLAVISFVCSIGNVPLAAALWAGGISFGGVVAFVFADLIALPLLLIYRRYYGSRLTLRLLAVFWATMSVAGLATDYLFRALGLAPTGRHTAHGDVGTGVFGLNVTTFLDVVAL